MVLDEFCKSIGRLTLTNAQKAVAILWFWDQEEAGIEKKSRELAKEIREHHIGNPDPGQLSKSIKATKCVYTRAGLFRLREDKKDEIRSWINDALVGMPETVPFDELFLTEEVYKSTRKYINQVCIQLNGSYFKGYFDCAAVMIRRLVETLIIESFEKENRGNEIKDTNGDYWMLKKLVIKTIGSTGLTLGRNSKSALKDIRELGNLSAHNRRYIAKKSDLDKVKVGLRVCVEELMNIADLYPKK